MSETDKSSNYDSAVNKIASNGIITLPYGAFIMEFELFKTKNAKNLFFGLFYKSLLLNKKNTMIKKDE